METSDIITNLLQKLEDERNRSHELTLIVLKQQGLLDEKIIVPEIDQGIGKVPWNVQKARLEKLYKKPEEDTESAC
jgi:hypothetical protein